MNKVGTSNTTLIGITISHKFHSEAWGKGVERALQTPTQLNEEPY